MSTPVLERAELFQRAMEHADAVQKEMYVFEDRERQSGAPAATLALRPEGTAGKTSVFFFFFIDLALSASTFFLFTTYYLDFAGIVRALVDAGALSHPFRVAYTGPMFRRERAQKGRFREVGFTSLQDCYQTV